MKLLFICCSCPTLRDRTNHLKRSWVVFQSSPGGISWCYYSLMGVSALGCAEKFLGLLASGGWWLGPCHFHVLTPGTVPHALLASPSGTLWRAWPRGCLTGWTPGPCVLSVSRSVVSDSSGPRGLWPARLLCPWGSPGKNTGWVGCHSLHLGIFPTQESNLGLAHCGQVLRHLSLHRSLWMPPQLLPD